MTSHIGVGDWVQASVEIAEKNMTGPGTWIHAKKGGVGRVMERQEAGWVFVLWERTGTSTDVHVDDLRRLCGADGLRVTG